MYKLPCVFLEKKIKKSMKALFIFLCKYNIKKKLTTIFHNLFDKFDELYTIKAET